MENVQEFLSEVMKYVYKEYAGVVEIEKLTRELEDALNHNDEKVAELILEMRQREMDSISQGRQVVEELLASMDVELREDVRQLLRGERPDRRTEFEAEKISSISRQRDNMLKNICTIDRILSRRVAGEDSYYK